MPKSSFHPSRRSTSFLSATIGLLIFLGSTITGYIADQQNIEHHKQQVENVLSSIKASLEGSIKSIIFLNQGLVALVSTRPDIARLELDRLATEMLNKSKLIRRVALLKHNEPSLIWPPYANPEDVIFDFSEFSAEITSQVIKNKKTVVIGSKVLKDGDYLIIYTPVFLSIEDSSEHDPPYWGMVGLLVDKTSLFWQTGLINENSPFQFALKTAAQFETPKYVFGNERLFHSDAVISEIELPFQSWKIAAKPTQGWAQNNLLFWFIPIGAILATLVSFLTSQVLNAQRTIHHMAMHDHLTHLPNRVLLNDRGEQALAKARRYNLKVAVLHIDLDNFKPINDNYGHKAGDIVLIEIARRMMACTRKMDTIARVGGDEFILLLCDLTDVSLAEIVAHKIINKINQPIAITPKLRVNKIGASIGIASYPENGLSLESLIREADAAMYKAKNNGKNCYSSIINEDLSH